MVRQAWGWLAVHGESAWAGIAMLILRTRLKAVRPRHNDYDLYGGYHHAPALLAKPGGKCELEVLMGMVYDVEIHRFETVMLWETLGRWHKQ